ncbi:50S ribosomal protein L31e [Candidatus Micrarchaeota archaeon]|nr:50S ribosomal protein L31e [Candidatus Micrarchaeota archaeon]
MAGELERIYTVNLGGVYVRGPRNTRAKRAVKELRSFIARHMKASEEKVKINNEVNSLLFACGMKKPPRRLKLRAKKDGEGAVVVSLVNSTEKPEAKKEEKAKKEKKQKPSKPKQEKKPVEEKPKEKENKNEGVQAEKNELR